MEQRRARRMLSNHESARRSPRRAGSISPSNQAPSQRVERVLERCGVQRRTQRERVARVRALFMRHAGVTTENE
jgi:hypothetical protein